MSCGAALRRTADHAIATKPRTGDPGLRADVHYVVRDANEIRKRAGSAECPTRGMPLHTVHGLADALKLNSPERHPNY
jgi:hypothetical protein